MHGRMLRKLTSNTSLFSLLADENGAGSAYQILGARLHAACHQPCGSEAFAESATESYKAAI